ncbi:DUF2304 domain-containing protein [Actinomyces sp. B33]|uniref:DUF2304 domain-containing protein n=1 Tax=Actinomyces sp. B33 TaxID=2942131 RepID=UPI00234262AE|nr:DUF2304 domain-containing protein [Actinomyces sp. B33]MDC4232646.1 DUF2304 domain-containing protein [Actinomyces sp. B33]
MSSTYWLGVLFGLIVLVAVFLRMRNSGMKERYATWWIVIAVSVAVFSLFPGALSSLSQLLGVQVPLNLGLVAAATVLLLLTLRLSVDLSRATEERRRLAEELALTNNRADDLADRVCRLEERLHE